MLIDTSWLVALERRSSVKPELHELLPGEASISAVTVAELRLGVELADDARRPRREAYVETVTALLPVLAFGETEAREYARLSALLRRAGTPVSDRDLMIAATALVHRFSVVTLNGSEFERIPGLQILERGLPAPE